MKYQQYGENENQPAAWRRWRGESQPESLAESVMKPENENGMA